MEIKKDPSRVKPTRKVKANVEDAEKDIQANVDYEASKQKPSPKPKVNNEYEEIKRKREKIFEEQKQKQKRERETIIVNKRNRKIYLLSFLLTMLVLFIFAPIMPVQDVNYDGMNYLRENDIKVKKQLGNYFSFFEYLRFEDELNSNKNDFIKSATLDYKLKEMTVTVTIDEFTPLAKDHENNVYFYEGNKIVTRDDIKVYAPVINGFDKESLERLLINLKELDYDVLMQIDTITYTPSDEDPDLLELGMDGGHTVLIDMEQMPKKLPYYNQIKQIIDETAGAKPGIIHLNVGDYYEPKD